LGTDGYGRSDSRERLRRFFRVDRHHIVVAALAALARQGEVEQSTVQQAITRYTIDPESDHPITR
ncbi:MAG: pyruvate dehydrogenase, partial [Desulfofustis sp.]|nr:pyruvate dehydrogenase [Desulfofustis sp.]